MVSVPHTMVAMDTVVNREQHIVPACAADVPCCAEDVRPHTVLAIRRRWGVVVGKFLWWPRTWCWGFHTGGPRFNLVAPPRCL